MHSHPFTLRRIENSPHNTTGTGFPLHVPHSLSEYRNSVWMTKAMHRGYAPLPVALGNKPAYLAPDSCCQPSSPSVIRFHMQPHGLVEVKECTKKSVNNSQHLFYDNSINDLSVMLRILRSGSFCRIHSHALAGTAHRSCMSSAISFSEREDTT